VVKKEGEMATIEISVSKYGGKSPIISSRRFPPSCGERMKRHFKTCAHCTAVLDGTRNVVGLVGDGRVFQMPEGFSKRLYKKLQKLPELRPGQCNLFRPKRISDVLVIHVHPQLQAPSLFLTPDVHIGDLCDESVRRRP